MRFNSIALCALLLVALSGCKDGNSPTAASSSPDPVATSTPSGPTEANVTGTILGAAFAATGQGNAIAFNVRLSETAGLGVNMNFFRVDVHAATGAFEERQEIGSGEIVRQLGTNRIEGGETREITVVIPFRATVKKGRILRITIGLTDDRGNDKTLFTDLVFS